VGERTAFPNKGSQCTLNPFNNIAKENKHGGPINLDGEEN
jgi:hypothetical protein